MFPIKLAALAALGGLSLLLTGVILLLLSPVLTFATFGMGFVVLIIVVLWGSIYIAMVIGATVVAWFHPMEVQKKGAYKLAQTKEAGKRQKGSS